VHETDPARRPPDQRGGGRIEGVALDREGHAHYVIDEEGHLALRRSCSSERVQRRVHPVGSAP
jgi:hypothetical protein